MGREQNAIIDWRLGEVLSIAREADIATHVAHSICDASRVSCAYFIMPTAEDLLAVTRCEKNHDAYRALVEFEAESTFALQGARWVGDTAPSLLSDSLRLRAALPRQGSAG